MRIKNTAFIYNVTVQGSSNCDWGTDIGQSPFLHILITSLFWLRALKRCL